MFVSNGMTFTYKVEKTRTNPTWSKEKVQNFFTNSISKASCVFDDMSVEIISGEIGNVKLYIHDGNTDNPVILRQTERKDEPNSQPGRTS